MTRRRAKRSHVTRYALIGWALIIAASVGITVWRVIGWLIITAVISGAAYALGRSQTAARAPGRKLRANAAYGKPGAVKGYTGGSLPRQPVTEIDAVSAYPADMMARARRNGWIAPVKSPMLVLSEYCAAGECVWCHDARCQHDCPHPSRGPAGDKPPF